MHVQWEPTEWVRMHFVLAQCEKLVAEAEASGTSFESLKLPADEFEACGFKPHASDKDKTFAYSFPRQLKYAKRRLTKYLLSAEMPTPADIEMAKSILDGLDPNWGDSDDEDVDGLDGQDSDDEEDTEGEGEDKDSEDEKDGEDEDGEDEKDGDDDDDGEDEDGGDDDEYEPKEEDDDDDDDESKEEDDDGEEDGEADDGEDENEEDDEEDDEEDNAEDEDELHMEKVRAASGSPKDLPPPKKMKSPSWPR